MTTITQSPTITRSRQQIETAIIWHEERLYREIRSHGDAVTVIRSGAKVRALTFIVAELTRDPASAPLMIAAACDRWRKARRGAYRTMRDGSQYDRNIAAAQIIEANAYIMTFVWALGAFDAIKRPRP